MIQGTLYITNSATVSDGGSKYIMGNDINGQEISIGIAQHYLKDNFQASMIPGRLHFNEKAISVRSEEEVNILNALKESILQGDNYEFDFKSAYQTVINLSNLSSAGELGAGYKTAYLMKLIIEFVESDEYEEIALRFNTKIIWTK